MPAAKQIVSNLISASLSATAKSNNIMLGQKVPKIIKDSKKAAINIAKAENSGLASSQNSNFS
jgi:chemotaxis protein CheY-P-specific phosphatase CheC